ncbi:hypothetical protein BDZ89DRAFT_1062410 [Hymenopellis radicata]|nr:hypothetical protein BDZ89DRAFT_1062410 [Hymenopellis radicata]
MAGMGMTACQRREADFSLCRQIQQQQQRCRNTAPTGHDERRTKQRRNVNNNRTAMTNQQRLRDRQRQSTAERHVNSGNRQRCSGNVLKAAMTTGNALNEERRSDNEGTRINGINAKDGHGSSRAHRKSAR